jgi:antitoxin (DNA-binding transcriptional repressor) of toxin-antitoxin stability system
VQRSTFERSPTQTVEIARSGSPVADLHPVSVDLREHHLTWKVNAWIATLFSPEHLDETAEPLAAVDNDQESWSRRSTWPMRATLLA